MLFFGKSGLIVLVVSLVAAYGAASASAQSLDLGQRTVPEGADWSEEYVESSDGTRLHVDVLLPEDRGPGERVGVLLVATSYGAHSGSQGAGGPVDPLREGPFHTLLQIKEIQPWKRGMAVVYADMRGFGASGGCVDFGAARDREDTLALIAWAARQAWSNGRVVLAGFSYSGIPALLALADPPAALKGVIPLSTLGSMYGALYTNRVPRDLTWFTPPPSVNYQYTAAEPGSARDKPEYHLGWARGLRPDCLADHHREQLDSERDTPYWREREWGAATSGSRVPVLASQGFWDFNVRADDFMSWWRGMTGWRAAWLGQFAHGSPTPARTGRTGFADLYARFLEARLKSGELVDSDRGVVVQEGPSGRWRREDRWPPATKPAELELLSGSYDDLPGNRAEPTDPETAATRDYNPQALAAREGVGTWTFSPVLERELHIAGEPKLRVATSGPAGANLFGLLYDVSPDGTARLITRGATRLEADNAEFSLLPQDWRVEAGHRIGLLLSGSEELWWTPRTRSLSTVNVISGELRLPARTDAPDTFLDGGRGGELDRHRDFDLRRTVDPASRVGRLTR